MSDKMPPLEPIPGSKFWASSPSDVLVANLEDALLVVRLGCAANALVSQRRFAAAAAKADGIAAARDLSAAMVISSGVTKEALKLIEANHQRVIDWSTVAGVPPEVLKEFSELRNGTHPASKLLTRIRNKLGFHFDPEVLRQALTELAEHESVIWVETGQLTAAELVHRLSSDAILTAIAPEPEEFKVWSPDERKRAGQERVRQALAVIGDAMTCVDLVIQYAVKAFLRAHGVDIQRSG
jgi:hypothetical protein